MNDQMKIFNTDNHCRICLTKSDQLFSMEKNIDVSQKSPTILEYFIHLLGDKVSLLILWIF